MGLLIRNLAFTVVVPGLGSLWIPWWILTRGGATPNPAAWPAAGFIAAGATLYFSCLWVFATVGQGTPGPWDAPRCFVAVGQYAWVRNPIYIAALLVVVGEAWLFQSLPVLIYAAALALGFQLLVVGYEEPTLRHRFGADYEAYRQRVPRWIPRAHPGP